MIKTTKANLLRYTKVFSILIFVFLFSINIVFSQTKEYYNSSIANNGVTVGDMDISGNKLTIEALVTFENVSGAKSIITKHTTGLNINYAFRGHVFETNIGGSYINITNPVTLLANVQYHLAAVYDGSFLYYYINGCEVARKAASGNLMLNNLNAIIGNANGSNEKITGYIDELRVWNIARTANQIKSNMFSISSPTSQVGLLAYYNFDAGNATNIQGNTAYNGTIYGTITYVTNPLTTLPVIYSDTINSSCIDTDLDGISNHIDIDDDNDGILDVAEGSGDYDNDGIFNQFDLDSDSDGCSDAFEGGVTSNITTNYQFPTTNVGTNGLNNSLETTVDNGIINYTQTYIKAIDSTNKWCNDTDNDGIADKYDIDDDNDGIRDGDECSDSTLITDPNNASNVYDPGIWTDVGFHQFVMKLNNKWYITGEDMDPLGTNDVLTPIEISSANGYIFSGNIIKASAGKDMVAILTDANNIYIWGSAKPNLLLTGGANFSSIINALPLGYNSQNVKKIKLAQVTMYLLMDDGTVWIRGNTSLVCYGAGTGNCVTDNWSQMKTDATTPLTNIKYMDAWESNGIAYANDGKYYAWGKNTYLGLGASSSDNKYATLLNEFPVGTPKEIQLGEDGSYYVHMQDSTISVMGDNLKGELGINTTINKLTWEKMLNTAGTSPIKLIMFSGNDYGNRCSMIDENKDFLILGDAFGDGSTYNLLGTGSFTSSIVKLPIKPVPSTLPKAIWTSMGGHLVHFVGVDGKFYNTGHNRGGGFGDGTTLSRKDFQGYPLPGLNLTNIQEPDKCDYDRDSILDFLDLDSDGDGCSDAFEGGSTTDKTTNYAFTGTMGTNGLDNSLETAVDNGIINYSQTYSKAIDSTDKWCTDTDNDGIADKYDIDDDNDGIRDGDECSDSTIINNPLGGGSAIYDPGIYTQSGYHGFVMNLNGKWYVSGEKTSPTGGDVLTPIEISTANGYNFTGNIVQASFLGHTGGLFTDDNKIYVFGFRADQLTGLTGFKQYGTLPASYTYQNVVHFTTQSSTSNNTSQVAFLMDDGTVWLKGTVDNACWGSGGNCTNTTTWHQVKVNATTPLTGVKLLSTDLENGFAYTQDGKYYAWGTRVYKGNSTAYVSTQTYATLLTEFPVGTPKQIIVNYVGSYYVVMSDNTVSVMGFNTVGQLGINTSVDQLTWSKMMDFTGADPVKINMISGFGSRSKISIIDQNQDFYVIGQAEATATYNILGMNSTTTQNLKLPTKPLPTTIPKAIWASTSGHLCHFVGVDGKFYNSGHNTAGGFGDGTTTDRLQFEGYTLPGINTTNIQAPSNCDYDKDSILDFLDIDSDGDGCSDAFEGGSTTDKTTNYAFTGTMGTNGLDNSLETAVDNGIINYTITYDSIALDSNIHTCTKIPTVLDTINEDSFISFCDTTITGNIADSLKIFSQSKQGLVTIEARCFKYTPNINYVGLDSMIVIYYKGGSPDTVTIITLVSTKIDTFGVKITNQNQTLLNLCDSSFITVNSDSTKLCNGGKNGTSTINGKCVDYTPKTNYIGKDTVCIINCNDGICDTAIQPIMIISVKDTLPTDTIGEKDTLKICDTNLINTSADSIKMCDGGENGTTTVTGTCLEYVPNPNYVGKDTICIIVCNDGICDTSIQPIVIGPGVTDTLPTDTIGEKDTLKICDSTITGSSADSIKMCDGGENGTITVTGTCIEYIPNPNYVGKDTLCIIVCNDGICDTSIQPIVIGPGVTDTLPTDTISEKDTLKICDSTITGSSADSIKMCDGGENGTTTVTGTCIEYVPNPNYVGKDTLCIIVCNDGICDTSIQPIIIGPGVTDTLPTDTIGEKDTLKICDSTITGSSADSIKMCDGGENGTTIVTGTCIEYVPNPNYVGKDTLCIIVCNDGICDTSIQPIVIGPGVTDTLPTDTIGEKDTLKICDSTITGSSADSIKMCDGGENGTTTITGTCIEYVPNPNYVGKDTLCIIVCNDGICDTSIQPIVIGPGITDTLPTDTIGEKDTLKICDSTITGSSADSIKMCDGGENGTTTISGTCIEYVPNPNYVGKDTLCIIVCNDGICDTSIQPIVIGPGVTDTLPTDTIGEKDTLKICDSTITGSSADSIKMCDVGENGTTTVTGTCIEYVPNPNYVGKDTLCIIVCNDGICDTSIQPIIIGPGVTDTLPTDTIGEKDTLKICDSTITGSSADSIKMCDGGENGTTTISGTCIEYVPNPNYVGKDTLCIIVCNDGICDTSIQPIVIGPGVTDTLPTDTIGEKDTLKICDSTITGSSADSIKMCDGGENGTTTITGTCLEYVPNPDYVGKDTLCIIVCNDGICDTSIQPIIIYSVTSFKYDTILEDSNFKEINLASAFTSFDSLYSCGNSPNGTVEVDGILKTFKYIPKKDFVGNDTSCYIICNDGVCDTTKYIITVLPVLEYIYDTTVEDKRAEICGITDSFDAVDSIVNCGNGTDGTVSTNALTGCFSYDPNPNFFGNDTLCYIICNDNQCDTTYVIETILPVKDTIYDTIYEGQVLTKNQLDTAYFGGVDNLSDCGNGYNGIFTTNYSLASFTYTPNQNYIGNDTSCLIIYNDNLIDASLVVITILPVKDSIYDTTKQNSVLNICGISDDFSNYDTIKNCGNGNNGIVVTNSLTSCFDYTPNTNFIGFDTACYIICNDSYCDTTVVFITVIPSNDTLTDTINELDKFKICDTNLLGMISDSIKICDGGENGNTTVSGTCFEYIPNKNYVGYDSICLITCKFGLCDSTIIQVVIKSSETDTLPTDTIGEKDTLKICDSTITGSSADSIKMCDGGENGTTTVTGTCIEYVPNPNYVGKDTLCIIVCNDGICDTSIQPIIIGPGVTDTLPTDTIGEKDTLKICDSTITGSSADSIKMCDGGENGTTTVTGTCLEYVPNPNYVGKDTICIIVCNDGICDTSIQPIIIGPGVTDTLPTDTIGEKDTLKICDSTITGSSADSIKMCDGGENGTTTVTGTCIEYVPNPNYVGKDTLCIIVCNDGICDTSIQPIVIGPGVTDTLPTDTIGEKDTLKICDSTITGSSADSIKICDGGENGTTIVTGTCIEYVPNPNYVGKDTLCIIVCNDGICDTSIQPIVIGPGVTDTLPTDTIGEKDTLKICDSTITGSSADSIKMCDGGENGTTTITGTCIEYVPNPNYVGKDTLCIIVCNDGICDTSIQPIIIGPGVTDTLPTDTIGEKDTLKICDSTITGSSADSIKMCDGGENGTTTVTGTCLEYVPNPNYVGKDTLCIIVCNDGICDTSIQPIIIGPGVTDTLPTDTIGEKDTLKICDSTITGSSADSIKMCDGGENGTTTITGTCIEYVPNPNYVGKDTLCIIVCNDGICDTSIQPIVIGPGVTDTLPTDTIGEKDTLKICDSTITGSSADSIKMCDGGENGTTIVTGTCIEYVPNPNYVGKDTLCIIVCNDGICDTSIQPIVIGPGVTDTLPTDTIGEKDTLKICDSTITGSSADSIKICDGGENGTTIVTGTCIEYVPNPNYVGKDTLCIIVCNDGICDTSIQPIVIGPGVTDTLPTDTIGEKDTLKICDSTITGSSADSIKMCDGGENGTTIVTGTCVEYVPNPNYVGKDTLCIIVCNDGICDTSILPIVIGPGVTDTLPTDTIGEKDTLKICDSTITGSSADSIKMCDGGENGTTTISGTCIEYVPNPNYVGKDTICIIVCNDGICDTSIQPIIIGPGVTDTLPTDTIGEKDTLKICDSNLIGSSADSIKMCDGGENGTTTITGTCLEYVPNPNYVGKDTLCIIVCNDGICDTSIQPIVIGPGVTDTLPTDTIGEKDTLIICDSTITGSSADSIKMCDGGENGTTIVTGTCIEYVPNPNYVGKDTICIIVCNDGICDTSIQPIIIGPGVTDTLPTDTIGEKDTLKICDSTITSSSADSIKMCDGGENGTTTVSGTCLEYVPNPNYVGKDTLCIIVCNDGICDTSIQPIVIGPGVTDTLPTDTIGEKDTLIICDSTITGSSADSIKMCDGGENGTTIVTGTCIEYVPNPNYVGKDTICIIVCNDGICDTSIQPIVIGPGVTDTLPTDTIGEKDTLKICDSTITGSSADSIKMCDGGENGTTTISGTCIEYVPNPNYVGKDTICIIVCNDGICDTSIQPIVVIPAKVDTLRVDTVPEGGLLVNCDSSITGSSADSIMICDGGENGTSTVNGTCVEYVPNPNYVGKDTLCIIVCNDGLCDTSIQPIVVIPAKVDTLTVDTVPEGGILVNCDSSIAGSSADSVMICDGGENGTSTVNGTCVEYIPNPNYVGYDTICIIVCNDGLCDTSIQPIVVIPAKVDTLTVDTVPEGGLLVNCDSSITGSSADSVMICDGGENGTSTLNGTCVEYIPNPNYVGKDTLCIIVCNDGLCDTSIQPIVVIPAKVDTLTVDTVPEGGLLVNCDSSITGSSADSVMICDGGENGTSTVNGTCVEYVPNPNYVGKDTLCIIVCNDGLCDTSIQPIVVIPAKVDTLTVDTVPEGGLLVNCDSSITGSSADSVMICDGGENGTSTVKGTCVEYIPNPNYVGYDTLCIIVCNDGLCDTSIQPIVVVPSKVDTLTVDTVPEGGLLVNCDSSITGSSADSVMICNGGENGTSTVNGTCVEYVANPNYVGKDTLCIIVCNDGLCDTSIQPIIVIPAKVDTLTVDTVPEGGLLVNCDSSITGSSADSIMICDGSENGTSTVNGTCVEYVPNPNYVGKDTLCIIVCNDGLCDTSIQPIVVVPAKVDTLTVDTVPEGGLLVNCDSSITGSSADSVMICNGGENGTSTVNGTCVEYVANPNYVGKDTLCIIVCNDGLCDTSIQPIIVIPAKVDTLTVDTVPEGGLLVNCDSSITGSSADSVMICDGGENGTSTVNGTCVEYIPNPNYVGKDTLCIIVCNDGICDTSIQPIVVIPAKVDTLTVDTVPEGGLLVNCDSSITGSSADSIMICDGGENGTSTVNGTCVEYIPNTNYVGYDTLCIIVCNDGLCDTSIQPIVVIPAKVDTLTVDTVPEGGLLVNCDSSITGSSADSVMICDGGENGTSTVNGTCVEYTPNPNYVGKDTLCIIVCNDGLCDTSIQPIVVKPSNIKDTIEIDINELDSLSICDKEITNSINSSDSVLICNNPTNGTLTINNTCFNYISNSNYVGKDTLCVIVCNDGFCDTTIVVISIHSKDIDTIIDNILPGDSITYCSEELINSVSDSIILCNSGQLGNTIINNNCITYIAGTSTIGEDTTCIIVCNDGLCDTNIIIHKVVLCDMIDEDSMFVQSITCDSVDICIPTPPQYVDFIVIDNDTINSLNSCTADSSVRYIQIGGLIDNLLPGETFNVFSWKTPNGTFSVNSLSSFQDLYNWMTSVDPNGNWELIGSNAIIANVNPSDYGKISLFNSNNSDILDKNIFITGFLDTKIKVSIGEHTVQFVSPFGCKDTMNLIVNCPPIINCVDTVHYLDQNGNLTLNSNDVTTSIIDINLDSTWLSNANFGCETLGEHTITVYAKDVYGIVDSCELMINVKDSTSPMAVCNNMTYSLDSTGLLVIKENELVLNSTDNCGITNIKADIDFFNCNNLGENSVILSLSDVSGNTSSCISTITVIDDIKPLLNCDLLANNKIEVNNPDCYYEVANFKNDVSISDNCVSSEYEITQIPFEGELVNIDNNSLKVEVMVTDVSGNMSSCQVEIESRCVKFLLIPEFISSNNDGDNDAWVIKDLERYPKNVVSIFNRWGVKVFEMRNYDNSFNGKSNINILPNLIKDKNELPAGTYFYIIEIDDQSNQLNYSGFLEISK